MIILPGIPRTKKTHNSAFCIPMTNAQAMNSKRDCGQRPIVNPSTTFERYQTECLWRLKECKERYTGPVSVQAHYWMKDKRSWPDLIGLLQGTSDILEAAGIITNDRDIHDYDGSRIVDIDKARPRVEIRITEVK